MTVRYLAVLALTLATTAHAQTFSFSAAAVDGENGVDGLDGPFRVAVSPEDTHVYVPGGGDKAVARFSRDAGTGVLTFLGATAGGDLGNLDDPTSIAVSPDGKHIYIGDFQNRLIVASRDAASGALAFVEAFTDGEGGVDGLLGPIETIVSPDGGHVYVSGRDENEIAIFSRDAGSGALTFVGAEAGPSQPRGLAFSPDGATLYITSSDNGGVVYAYARNASAGTLTFAAQVEVADATDIALSPDGAHLYISSSSDTGIHVASTIPGGDSRFPIIESLSTPDLSSPQSVVVAPNGQAVYVGGGFKVGEFTRDPSTGKLTFVAAIVGGSGGATGLSGIRDITLSADGRSLYTVASVSNALATFSTPNAVSSADGPAVAAGALEVFPNPSASSQARVRLTMDEPGPLELALYDVVGRRLAVLFSGDVASGQSVEAALPSRLAAGVYLLRVEGSPSGPSTRVVVSR
ncbi:MAG: hypothetical protein Rubg2KO_39970 [Rubricoccaceae bacterium]